MISDRQLAVLCKGTYDPLVRWAFAGSTFHATMTNIIDGPVILACEGSHSLGDWASDFMIFGLETVDHPYLGLVHAGFNRTTDECLAPIIGTLAKIGYPVILTGHSKGGAEAEMLAAKLTVAGIKVVGLVTFGTPRWVLSGNIMVAPLLPAALGTSYRHFKDVVPEVPPLPWTHPTTRPVVEIGTGKFIDLMYPPAMHHIEGYIASLPE